MADDEDPVDPANLPEDLVTKRLVLDPKNIPNLIVLVGFLGRSTRVEEPDDGKWRLYLTPALNDYITFERTAVLHLKDLTSGGTMVWLKRDVTVQHTHIETRQMQTDFLMGELMNNAQNSLPGFPHRGSGGPNGTDGVTFDGCPPSISRC